MPPDSLIDNSLGILPGFNPNGKCSKSRVGAEQQERRNDRASEHDQQVPQRPGLAKHGHRPDPQENSTGNAERSNGTRQRGRVD